MPAARSIRLHSQALRRPAANLIVVDLAQKSGVVIDWRMHARVGVPVTLLTLGLVWAWLHWLNP